MEIIESNIVEIKLNGVVNLELKIINGVIMRIVIKDPNDNLNSFHVPHDNTIKSLLKLRALFGDMIGICLEYLNKDAQ